MWKLRLKLICFQKILAGRHFVPNCVFVGTHNSPFVSIYSGTIQFKFPKFT